MKHLYLLMFLQFIIVACNNGKKTEKRLSTKTIENTFAEITAKFPKKIHAVTAKGFLLKILIFIILVLVCCVDDKCQSYKGSARQ